jgi:hypothetical protein
MVGALAPEDLATALGYVREWNTNARNAHLAQALLAAILRSRPPADILAVPGGARGGGGVVLRGTGGGGSCVCMGGVLVCEGWGS